MQDTQNNNENGDCEEQIFRERPPDSDRPLFKKKGDAKAAKPVPKIKVDRHVNDKNVEEETPQFSSPK